MAMEMNKAWATSDYKALAKRLAYAAGDMAGTAKSKELSPSEIADYRAVAATCKMFLKAFEPINPYKE